MKTETTNGSALFLDDTINVEYLLQYFEKQLHMRDKNIERCYETMDILKHEVEQLKKQDFHLMQHRAHIAQGQSK